MKLLEVKIPNSNDHVAIYYEGSISNVYLWEDGKESTMDAPPCEVVTDEDK